MAFALARAVDSYIWERDQRYQESRINMIEQFPTQTIDRIHMKTEGKIVFVPVKSICWLESAGNYVEVFLSSEGQRLLVRETLSSFEQRLQGRSFLRIHRSVIVNTDRIREMRPCYTGEYDVVLDNGKHLTLSRGYRHNLNRLLETAKYVRSA
jgi:two-component system LytT family response regulator